MPDRPSARILVATGAALLLIAWSVAVGLSLRHQRDASGVAFDQSRTGQVMLTAMLDQETGLRGFQSSGEETFLQPYVDGRRQFSVAAQEVRAGLMGDRAALRPLDDQIALTARWQALAAAAVTDRRADRPDDMARDVAMKGLVDRFRAANATLQTQLSARRDRQVTDANRQTLGLVVGMSLLAALLAFAVMRRTRRVELRYRRGQEEFAEALQASKDEKGAHALLKRHVERSVHDTEAHVLNRNNSADRLEAATVVEPGSPLAHGLVDAEPSSCVAVHTARPYERAAGALPLLECDVCGGLPGTVTCRPMVVGGEVIGSLLTAHGQRVHPSDLRHLTESVAQAAPVLGNLRTLAIAEARASTDALTGLPNRRAIHDAFTRMLALAGRTGAPLAAILFDLDHFKRVNDTAGHDKGDEVLAAVSHAVTATLRASDFAGRYGGEEFLVLLPDTDEAGAAKLCEVLRTTVAQVTVPGVGQAVTASFGVAVFPDDAPDAERLLRLADRALYQAKANGRNRVELAAVGSTGGTTTALIQVVDSI